MISKEDQRLIDLSVTGNRLAQGNIYRKYIKAMYHIAIRMVAEKELARDLTQDAFVKVFEKLDGFNRTSTLGAWIKRITINTCLDHLRRAGFLRMDELEESILDIASEEDERIEEVDISAVHEAIKSLPTGCRTVMNLYLLEGYRHSEIAEILEISMSTSKTHYRRGKLLLREKLKTVYYNED